MGVTIINPYVPNYDTEGNHLWPDSMIPWFVIGGDHHLHNHQFGNGMNERGVPNRVEQGLSVFLEGWLYAARNRVPFILNGDLTHNKNALDPVVTWHLLDLLDRGSKDSLLSLAPVILNVGNHERPEKFSKLHTLKIFERYVAHVVGEPTDIRFFRVKDRTVLTEGPSYGCLHARIVPFKYNHKEAIAAAEKPSMTGREATVLIGHYPTNGVEINGYRLPSPVQFEDFHPNLYTACLFSDIHRHQAVGANGYHLGATMQNNFGEAGYDTGFWVFATHAGTGQPYLYRLPANGKEFFYVDTEEEAARLRQSGHYVRIKPAKIIERSMSEAGKARLDLNASNLGDAIFKFLKMQVEGGKIKATDFSEVQKRVLSVLGTQ